METTSRPPCFEKHKLGFFREKSDTSNLPSPSCYHYNLQILEDMGSGDDGIREDVTFESLRLESPPFQIAIIILAVENKQPPAPN